MSEYQTNLPTFNELGLSESVMQVLNDVGYETPTPIQAKTIPLMLAGKDLFGQAQTGTGKTAAFALPILTQIDLSQSNPQVLVLAPTRELAIQVAEAFHRYASHMRGFKVLPIYGGQDYEIQIRQLRRGVHVVVGTPGRVMDHMRRGTLTLTHLRWLILDEGDEMLRMGFIDDVEWILEQTPAERQTALFSATLPKPIRKIAQKYLRDPEEITIKVKTTTAETINQRYWMVSQTNKLDALTRILEAESFDGILIFVRTKTETVELAEKLEARGFAVAPLNGDIVQKQRERTIHRLKARELDILVATDVAARGLDVERISHVINYDIPYDTEAYVHRIGRTGRAGRSGEAVLFVAPREQRMLHAIEKATNQKIEKMRLPSTHDINNKRIDRFKEKITDALAVEQLGFYYQLVEEYQQEHNVPALEIAAALAHLAQGGKPFLLSNKPIQEEKPVEDQRHKRKAERIQAEPEVGMERYRVAVGYDHGTKPGNLVGALANEGGIESKHIGRIEIFDDFSTVDLSTSVTPEQMQALQKIRLFGQALRVSKWGETPPASPSREPSRSRDRAERQEQSRSRDRGERPSTPPAKDRAERKRPATVEAIPAAPQGKERYLLRVGHVHGAQTRHIVGAIANEGGIDSKLIGRIEIFDQYSTVDLPEGLTPEILRALQKTRLYGQAFKTTRWDESLPLPENKPESAPPARPAKDEKPRPEKKKKEKEQPKETESQKPEWGMERYRVEVGESHGVKPSQIIGAISNEGGLDPQYVGKIELFADYSLVDLPEGMPRDILRILKKARVMGQSLKISRLDAPTEKYKGERKDKFEKKEKAKKKSDPSHKKHYKN